MYLLIIFVHVYIDRIVGGAMVLGEFPVPGRVTYLDGTCSRERHRYLGSVIFAFKTTLTTLNHITCINTFGQGFKKDAIRYQCSLY